jgi:hypothetical protein
MNNNFYFNALVQAAKNLGITNDDVVAMKEAHKITSEEALEALIAHK